MERKPPLPAELWDPISPPAQAAIRVLLENYEQRIAALEAEVAELKGQLNQNSPNSLRSPSLDEPPVKSRSPQESADRQYGVQPGYWKRMIGFGTSHMPSDARKRYSIMIASWAIGISFLLGFNAGLYPVTIGSDDSFIYAFNIAATKGLQWGQEFISTYGPYGFLLASIDVGNHLQGRVIFAFALSIGIGLAVAVYLRSFSELRLVKKIFLVPILVYLVILQAGDEYRVFCVLILLLLTGLNSRLSIIYLGIGGLLAGFSLLMKFSLGFGALLTLAISCILITLWRRLTVLGVLVAAITTTSSFIISWIAYSSTISGIGAYLSTGLEASNGYSSAMSFAPSNWWIGVASFMVYALILSIWTVRQRDTQIKITMALLAFPLFVAWKHSVVRQDGHVIIGIMFGLFVIGVLITHAVAANRTWRTLPVMGILMILLLIPWFNPLTGGEHPGVSFLAMLQQAASLQGLQYLGFLQDPAGYRQRLAQASEGPLRSMALPESIRRRIGESSIDVYPWELSLIPANGLHWINRPLPASYSAYTPTLDKLNAAFLRSASKPEYILWHDTGMTSIDERYLLFDEPETVRAIFGHYDLVETSARVSLLHARSGERWMAPEVVGTVATSWNEWVTVPQISGVVLAQVSVRPSLAMRLSRALFREGRMTLTARLASGEEMTFRTVPDNMASGLWITPFPISFSELGALLQGRPAREVVAVRFNAGFIPETTSSTLVISWLQLMPRAEPDKAPVGETPVVKAVGEGCAGFIDAAFVRRDWYGRMYIDAVGWARDGELPIRQNTLWLTDGTGNVLPTEAEVGLLRPDVAKDLGVNSLEQSGWQASARVSEVNDEIGYIIESRSGIFLRSCNRVIASRARKVAFSNALPIH